MSMPQLSSSSGYTPGSSYTNTGGVDYGQAAQLADLLSRERTYLTRAAVAPRPAVPAAAPQASAPMRAAAPVRALDSAPPAKPIETPWYTYQGAATRPVGMGAQMIPGMQADQNLLPPWMRATASSFTNAGPRPVTGGDAYAALSAPRTAYEGGGAQGPGADFERDRMNKALAISNAEYAKRQG